MTNGRISVEPGAVSLLPSLDRLFMSACVARCMLNPAHVAFASYHLEAGTERYTLVVEGSFRAYHPAEPAALRLRGLV